MNARNARDSGSQIMKHKESQSMTARGGKNSYMDSDFWYHKGVILNKKNCSDDSALKCYLQAYELNN
jgi:hypothetical protein